MYETTYYLFGLLTIASIAHFILPFLLSLIILKKKWYYGLLILISFEILENTYFAIHPLIVCGIAVATPEIFINIIADLILGTLGLYLGFIVSEKVKKKKAT